MNNKGYSLIEVLAALAIFALAIGGVMALLHAASSSQAMSINRVNMALLARTVIDEARLEARLGREPKVAANAVHPLFPKYNYDVDTYPMDVYGREYLLHIIVRWYPIGKTRAPLARPKTAKSSKDSGKPAAPRTKEYTEPHVSYYSIVFVEE